MAPGFWLTLLTAGAGALLVVAGRRLQLLSWAGLGLLAFALLRLLLGESLAAIAVRQPWALHRGILYLAVAAALVVAGRAMPWPRQVPGAIRKGVWVTASLLPPWYITLEIVLALDGRTNGRFAGNQVMWTAAAWGLYGLLLALGGVWSRSQPLRDGALFMLTGALGFLAVAALPGNARWAEGPVRLAAYAGVFGSILLVEALQRRYFPDAQTNGLLATAAAVAAVYALSFEVDRLLEPFFTLPDGQFITADQLRANQSTAAFTRLTVWGGYGLLLLLSGRYVRSTAVRQVAAGVFGFALLYGLLTALRNRTAPPVLQLAAFLLVAVGSALAARELIKGRGQTGSHTG